MIQAGQHGLLRQQHARGGELQTGEDLLPQFHQVGTGRGRCWCGSSHSDGSSRCGRAWDDRRRGWWCSNRSRSWGCSDGGGANRLRFGEQAEQQHFQPQTRLHALAQLLLAPLELGLPAQQRCLADTPGQIWQGAAELGRKAGELEPVGGYARQHQIPQQASQPLQHGRGFAAPLQQGADRLDQSQGLAGRQRFGQLQQLLFGHRPQQFPHRLGLHRRWQQAELIQQAFGVAQAALGPLSHHVQGFGGDADLFLLRDPAQVPLQGIQGDAAEIEALAAAEDGGQHPLGVGGGQHEHHPRRRLLQRFEQGVERRGGEHVALIHHIHLPAGLHRRKARALDQLADVVHAGVGGGVDLDHIEGVAVGDRGAELTGAAGLRRRAIGANAVE